MFYPKSIIYFKQYENLTPHNMNTSNKNYSKENNQFLFLKLYICSESSLKLQDIVDRVSKHVPFKGFLYDGRYQMLTSLSRFDTKDKW